MAGGVNDQDVPIGAVELYDPLTETWSLVASILSPRLHATLTPTVDGKTLFAGGTADNVTPDNAADLFELRAYPRNSPDA